MLEFVNWYLVFLIGAIVGIIVLFGVAIGLMLKKSWRFNLIRKSYGWAHFHKREGDNFWEIFKTPFSFGTNKLSYKGTTYIINFANTEYEGIKSEKQLQKESKKEKKNNTNTTPSLAIFDKKKRPNIHYEIGNPYSIQFGHAPSKFRNSGKILQSVVNSDLVGNMFRSKREKFMFVLTVLAFGGLIAALIGIMYLATIPPTIIYVNQTVPLIPVS